MMTEFKDAKTSNDPIVNRFFSPISTAISV